MQVAIIGQGSYNRPMPKRKIKVAAMAFRFTEDAAWLLEQCSLITAESKAGVLERLIRGEARRLNIKLSAKPTEPAPKEEG